MEFANASVNFTNVTNGFKPTKLTIILVDIIFYIDVLVRVFSALIHIFYFVLVFFVSELRNRSLAYVHHCNMISFLFNFHYLLYFNFVHPFYSDINLNNIICTISEFSWGMLKLLRTYSIALIAIYRFIAVLSQNFFKKINNSIICLLIPILIIYLICTLIFLTSKYGLNTTYGYLYCFDGYSKISLVSLEYFFIQSTVGILLPVILTCLLYFLISNELKKSNDRLKINSEISMVKNKKVSVKENKFQANLAKQFFFINLCEIVSSIMVIGLGLRYSLPELNEYYNVPRFLLRTINLFFQALVPCVSIYYNPFIAKKIKIWKAKMLGKPPPIEASSKTGFGDSINAIQQSYL